MDKEFFEMLHSRVERYLGELNQFILDPNYYLSVGEICDFGGKINLFNWSKRSEGGIVEILQGEGQIRSVFGIDDLVIGDIHYIRKEINEKVNGFSRKGYMELLSLFLKGEFKLIDVQGAQKINAGKRDYTFVNVSIRKKCLVSDGKTEVVSHKSKGDVLVINYNSRLVKAFREKIFSLDI
ncbi:hypothetical protein J4477_03545 [Candidatus Pacearchaeota archaeon]|nr:hypothetical protein [Candidatus Pacearchaeota archaeon]